MASSVPLASAPGVRRPSRAAVFLFVFGLAVYAATRLVGVTEFPIFFFCDEALQANVAEQLFRNHFRDAQGVLLPPFFLNDQRWAMSLNIYLLLAPIVVLGKTILVTRGTFVLVGVFGAAALGIALRTAGIGLWWTAPLLLASLPVDFLHSRWAMETTPGWFAGFLCAYLLYRLRSPRYVFLVLALGAATVYSYTAGQGIVLVMGVLLLLVDARYHFRQSPRLLAAAVLFFVLLAVPLVREHRRHPGTTRRQLEVLNSYWLAPTPLSEKLATFGRHYVQAFDPRYWFRPNGTELIRHRMDRMPFVPLAFAPFVAIGIVSCLVRFRRSPGHRVILLSPFGVPFAAAVHLRQILRLLPMVVPIVLLAAVGAEEIYRLARRWIPEGALIAGLATALAIASIRLPVIALAEGPTWFPEYGLYGLQYGARQIFDGVKSELRRSPHLQVRVSSSWANNPEPFLDFFLSGEQRERVALGDLGPHRFRLIPFGYDKLFVLTRDEYESAKSDPKLVLSPPTRTILYPDGQPGFYFVRARYSPNADALFAAEFEERRKPKEETITLSGERVLVRYSAIDMGSLPDVFDGNFNTLVRGLEANPFVLELVFEKPRPLSGLTLSLGQLEGKIKLEVTPAGDGQTQPLVQTREVHNRPQETRHDFTFPSGGIQAARVRIEIHEPAVGEPDHIELREIVFR